MAVLTATDVVNRALNLVGGNQTPVTGTLPNFDGSVVGKACGNLYPGVVQTVARQWGWDALRTVVALVLSGNPAPAALGYAFEYLYPNLGVQIRQILPAAVVDPNDPLPQNLTVGNAVVASVPTKVIWSNVPNAQVVFTGQPPEGNWDALFTEDVVRLLASELAMAVEARPDTARDSFEQSGEIGQLGARRDL